MPSIYDFLNFSNPGNFTQKALELFRFQYEHNPVYKRFTDALHCNIHKISALEQIPFLPISFFKQHQIKTTTFDPEAVFESSGTTGTATSRHFVKHLHICQQSFAASFEKVYGPVQQFCILGLLPSYLERGNSSLVYMVQKMIELSQHPLSGFYLYNVEELFGVLKELEARGQKTLLIGVTYALLDFAKTHPLELKNTIIMETGGMKGRRKELLRAEVHEQLKESFKLTHIHSEYGMTELLSQVYALQDGYFRAPPWMKVLIRAEDDPFAIVSTTTQTASGALNIIDLANIYSCSFIATDDIGRLHADGSFEVLGRLDNSDVRGCSLLVI